MEVEVRPGIPREPSPNDDGEELLIPVVGELTDSTRSLPPHIQQLIEDWQISEHLKAMEQSNYPDWVLNMY
jgi:hypothetical protein